MCLSQVECAPKVDSRQILSFYMNKNTPERKDYMMENLMVAVGSEGTGQDSVAACRWIFDGTRWLTGGTPFVLTPPLQ